jgi:isopenicillin-N N-acyltransferase-like protein
VGFTEAGIVGCKMGVNSAGLALCVAGLITARDGANGRRKPMHVRCAEILDAPRFDKAIEVVVGVDRTCSTNFLIAHRDGEILNIEATPDFCSYGYPEGGVITHANHLETERRIASEFERVAPHSLFRGNRLKRLLTARFGKIDVPMINEILADGFSAPAAICRDSDPAVPEAKRIITVAAIAIDLEELALYATAGKPSEYKFEKFTLN